ncbi:MAG: hypothetical protein H8E44_33405 [Planctomycetes bacterium]|nr:hypothetical protein [Planctomycetota bacterium]MBL7037384.1 hypothetical protein [Pirellulaceae bacterium]
MASNLIESSQAAEKLGVSEDELNDMRLRGEIHGVRDGASWKFKDDEIERVAEEKGISTAGGADEGAMDVSDLDAAGSSDLALDLEAGDAGDAPTAIGSLEDLEAAPAGESGLTLSSGEEQDEDLTIGDDDDLLAPSESDVLGGLGEGSDAGLLSDSDKDVLGAGSDSDKDVLGGGSGSGAGSDVALVPDDDGSGLNLIADSSADVLGGSDAMLDEGGTGSGGTGPNLGSGELDFEGSDIGIVSDLSLDDDLALGEDEEDELTIGDEEELALDEDDELVLDGGSDVTRGAGDTGINLTSPSDSGLNLEEEPLDLAGSSVSSLELPEDDDIIDLDDLDAGPDEATQLKIDEDFQLAPSAEAEEDDDDSGSQVIALEDSEAFEQAAPAAALDAVEPIVGEEGTDELETALDEAEVGSVTKPALPDSAYMADSPELPYSIWNVLSLLVIVMLLAFTGMLMTDVIRNMWSWESTYTASTPIMDMMIRLFGMEP